MHEIKTELNKANQQMTKDRASEEILVKDWQKQQANLKKLSTLGKNLLKGKGTVPDGSRTHTTTTSVSHK